MAVSHFVPKSEHRNFRQLTPAQRLARLGSSDYGIIPNDRCPATLKVSSGGATTCRDMPVKFVATTSCLGQTAWPVHAAKYGSAAKGSGGRWDFLWPLEAIKLNIVSNVLRGSNGL
jgi:hypothetical protein